MMVSMTMIQAAALLLLLTVTCSSSFSLPPPSYGDIKLDDNGVVLIYTEHDYDHHEDNVWMAIDFYNSQHREELTETLCHQLGYSDGILFGKVLDTTNVSVYLTDVKCEKKMNHILRCKHKAKQEEYSAQQRVIALTCHNKITKKYEGQISLYPPDGLSPYQSVSTGVISLYSGKDPLFIIQNDEPPLTSNAANTFCRQMGFTKYIPESVMSIADAYQRHGYTFDNFLSDVTLSINASLINCLQSCQCTRCCTNNVVPQQNEKPGSPNGALSIRCVFDDQDLQSSHTLTSDGTREECEISDSQTYTNDAIICGAKDSIMTNAQFIGTIVGGVAGAIIITILVALAIVYVRYKYKKDRRRGGYQPVGGGPNGGPNGGNGGPHGGNGGPHGGNGGPHGGNGGPHGGNGDGD